MNWTPSVCESDCEGTPDNQWNSRGDDCWRASTLGLHTNSDLQVLVTVRGRPTTMEWSSRGDELQPWDWTRTLTSKCSWEWPWGDARRLMELMRWWLLTSFNPGTAHELWPPSVRESDCEEMPDGQWRRGDDCWWASTLGRNTNSDLQVSVRVTVRGRPTLTKWRLLTSFNPGTAHELWPPSVHESDREGTPDDQWSSWDDDCWWASTLGLNTNFGLQVFVRVTVRGRLTTNGAHEVTTADELQPWDCTRTLTSKCSWEWPWGDARWPMELMRWRLLTSFNPETTHELWPQVFVRVTVRRRPTTNGTHEVMTADKASTLGLHTNSDLQVLVTVRGRPTTMEWSSWGDDCWRASILGLNTNSDLQVFVRVTVRGRPMTNGAHDCWRASTLGLHTNSDLQVSVRVTVRGRPTLTKWRLLTSFNPGTAHELWPPSVHESDREGTPDDQWSSWDDDCWRASTLGLNTNFDPKCSWEWLWGDARQPMEFAGLHTNSHDLQVFVRVTVRGRPMTNGAHEVTTANELQPWDCTRTGP